MSLSESLREMGFEEKMISKAIKRSKADTLEQAIEWIIQNQDRDLSSDDEPSAVIEPQASEPKKAKTQEELDQEKKRIEDLIKKRKQEREEVERREQVERERLRRKAGNEIVHIREKMENEERVRAAQEMRRERAENETHRQKILDEIKRDRERMKQGSAGEPNKPPSTEASKKSPVVASSVSYDTCRLAIRLPDGSSLMQTFQANEQLCAVRLFVQLNRKDLDPESARVSRFNLLMPPCQTFSDDDMDRTLRDLGLCPSARLTIGEMK